MSSNSREHISTVGTATSTHYLEHINGWPHYVSTTVAFRKDLAPSREWLADHLSQAQKRYPDLRLEFVNLPRPSGHEGVWSSIHWKLREKPWALDDVYTELPDVPSSTLEAWQIALEIAEKESLVSRPLWMIQRMTAADTVYLSFTMSHKFLDGLGMVNLVRILLTPNFDGLPDETDLGHFVKNLEIPSKVIPEKPYEPWTPRPQPETTEAPIWPHAPEDYGHLISLDHPQIFEELDLPADDVMAISRNAKSHQIPTLNPVLLASFLQALSEELDVHRRFQYIVPIGTRKSTDPFFFSGYSTAVFPVTSPKPHEKILWEVAKEVADGIKAALDESNAPPPPPAPAPAETKDEAENIEDGTSPAMADPPAIATEQPEFSPESSWKRMQEIMQSERFYKFSMVFSNLTRLPWLNDIRGVDDFLWGQSMNICPAPFIINLVGWKGGVRATVGFRDGCGVSAAQGEQIAKRWRRILAAAATDEDIVNGTEKLEL
ncbi:hypothetical protein BD324DRAFT_637997 [Kockovaella imperatae]|uniref:Alcohol acetyltransferase n=1 Tax=Kockovaella imperatae TaxID=4999 RepID=A0A1Y1U922_9TREE|nr:hypothetical protein BD324DRAFT_637997 [Kockovaella imperatae]ORX34006.1 hypothetical protein BD324DRAFT_637997 [Kockovaella imperatae]